MFSTADSQSSILCDLFTLEGLLYPTIASFSVFCWVVQRWMTIWFWVSVTSKTLSVPQHQYRLRADTDVICAVEQKGLACETNYSWAVRIIKLLCFPPTLTSLQSPYTVNLLHGVSNYERTKKLRSANKLCGGVPRVNYDLQATVSYISVLYLPRPVFMNCSIHSRRYLLAQIDQHPRNRVLLS